jgi:hypothetical protein
MPDKASHETTRIVLALDTAIAAFRAREPTGLRALDAASRLIGELPADVADRDATVRRGGQGRGPRRPDRVELAILTALADTYGSEKLTNASLGYALRLVARHGGVSLVQRVLWGESASDAQLAATRAAFTQISSSFSDTFLADAKEVIAGFLSRPPGEAKSPKDSDDCVVTVTNGDTAKDLAAVRP